LLQEELAHIGFAFLLILFAIINLVVLCVLVYFAEQVWEQNIFLEASILDFALTTLAPHVLHTSVTLLCLDNL